VAALNCSSAVVSPASCNGERGRLAWSDELSLQVAEAGRDEQKLQRLGVNEANVSEVHPEPAVVYQQAFGVERLDDQYAVGSQLVVGEAHESQQDWRRQVLDHLAGKDAAERRVGQRGEVRQQVGFEHVELLLAAAQNHVVAEVDPARCDPGIA